MITTGTEEALDNWNHGSFGLNMAMVDGGHKVPCFGVHPVPLGDQSTRDAQTMKINCPLCTKYTCFNAPEIKQNNLGNYFKWSSSICYIQLNTITFKLQILQLVGWGIFRHSIDRH